ncbi:Hypothetical protein SRAE_1000049100 [Strongyloides ratti]|uniref:Uncharacterized protein n=1 Tax=Strongyloides ratti TaxID=34506 RepID=A0A090MUI0_STRRB|nr:Hypothetical protein SRAE_1000049100 [Strongyloides ratti]CEF62218.1 Hypothetical protein SRAE_1000049100 [Strongyloides ratti]
MIFEIPLEHFPQPFAKIVSTSNSNYQSNFIKCAGNKILSKMRESLSFDNHQSNIVSLDSFHGKILEPQKEIQNKRRNFVQKYNSKSFSTDFNTNFSLLSIKKNFYQSITSLKSQILTSTDQPPK